MSDRDVVLGYSTPRCLFERAYRHRSLNGAVGLVVTSVFGTFSAVAARDGFGAATGSALPPAATGTASAVILMLIALACAVGFVWLLVQWVRNATDPARITEDGIELKGRAYPWENISAVYGSKMAGGVLVQFTTRASTARPGGWLGFMLPKHVMTTPFLTLAEFETLMESLAAHVAPHHRHVALDRTPRSPD